MAVEPPAACMSLAAASALSFDRDPSTIRYPAPAQRFASAEPRSPVPPRVAMVGRSCNDLTLFAQANSTFRTFARALRPHPDGSHSSFETPASRAPQDEGDCRRTRLLK